MSLLNINDPLVHTEGLCTHCAALRWLTINAFMDAYQISALISCLFAAIPSNQLDESDIAAGSWRRKNRPCPLCRARILDTE